MNTQKILKIILLGITLFASTVNAEQSETFSEYTVHYNAIRTDALDPTVATAYKIKRSKNRILLNISVLIDNMGTSVKPVKATVSATATNLNAQLRNITIRELQDAGAIYYIGELVVNNEETLNFKVLVQPEGSEEVHTLTFQQQFFTE